MTLVRLRRCLFIVEHFPPMIVRQKSKRFQMDRERERERQRGKYWLWSRMWLKRKLKEIYHEPGSACFCSFVCISSDDTI